MKECVEVRHAQWARLARELAVECGSLQMDLGAMLPFGILLAVMSLDSVIRQFNARQ